LKFLGTSTKKVVTTCDKVEDPKILSHQLLNTKKSFRYKAYTHVRISEISKFCPREYAIGYQTDSKQTSFVEFPMQQQFDLGSAIHWWLQNKSKVFDIYGWWKCKSCQTTRLNKYGTKYFGPKPKTPCLNCNAHHEATEYEEFYFRVDSPYRVVGKIDGIIVKDDVYRFVDFKSYWEQPKTGFPNGDDVAQLASYAFFYSQLPSELQFPVPIDTESSYLHYISKKFSYSDSILTYTVKQNDKMINKIKEKVAAFTRAVDDGSVPEPLDYCIRNKWESGRSKQCFLSDICKKYYQEGK
jgi:hypothetical protein